MNRRSLIKSLFTIAIAPKILSELDLVASEWEPVATLKNEYCYYNFTEWYGYGVSKTFGPTIEYSGTNIEREVKFNSYITECPNTY